MSIFSRASLFDPSCFSLALCWSVSRSDDVWVITRRQVVVARATLLDGWGNLLPKPLAIFDQWFRDFQVFTSYLGVVVVGVAISIVIFIC